MSQRALSRGLLACSALVAFALSSSSSTTARAAGPSVQVGEVTVQGAAPELVPALRALLLDELSQLGEAKLAARRSLVVSARLVRLASEQHERSAKASAAISLALRHADDQALCAELVGRASAEEAGISLESVRKTALRAAVRSAVARLPEAAARSR